MNIRLGIFILTGLLASNGLMMGMSSDVHDKVNALESDRHKILLDIDLSKRAIDRSKQGIDNYRKSILSRQKKIEDAKNNVGGELSIKEMEEYIAKLEVAIKQSTERLEIEDGKQRVAEQKYREIDQQIKDLREGEEFQRKQEEIERRNKPFSKEEIEERHKIFERSEENERERKAEWEKWEEKHRKEDEEKKQQRKKDAEERQREAERPNEPKQNEDKNDGGKSQKPHISRFQKAVLSSVVAVVVAGAFYAGLRWYQKKQISKVVAQYGRMQDDFSARQRDMMAAAVLASSGAPGTINYLQSLISKYDIDSEGVDEALMWQILAQLYWRKSVDGQMIAQFKTQVGTAH